MRTDFESIENNSRVLLYPYSDNPLYKAPHEATFSDGYYYCALSNPLDGPDYYFGDVATYNKGFILL